jgi:TRAP-type C4-dicarboxylate transport system permease small subunit
VAEELQHRAAAQCSRISATGTANDYPNGPETVNALTMELDQSAGAGQLGIRMFDALAFVLRLFILLNTFVLRLGRTIAWTALALMVAVILLQVFFRYVLNNALAWPDEAARFLMLWMTGMIAPSAYRWGGFVAIDMLPQALPKRAGLLLALMLLVLSGFVLMVAISFGWGHTMGFGGNFDSSSLRIPLDWVGLETIKVKLRYMYGSLLVGVTLLFAVNIELILRTVIGIIRPDAQLPGDDRVVMASAD